VQSAVIFFFIRFTYQSPTSRSDGYDVYINEMSTTMAMSAVMVANVSISVLANNME
jgi:phospholipid-translocating ATPase